MMLNTHIKMAIRTIRGARVRSLLTMLGIVIGVTSITLTVALAQGIKSNTISQLNKLGDTFITVQPGVASDQNSLEQLRQLDISGLLRPTSNVTPLSEKDATSVEETKNVVESAPVMQISGSVANGSTKLESVSIIATSPDFPSVLSKQVDSGAFFADSEITKPFAILGHNTAQSLFGADAPLGSTITIRGSEFTVLGIMQSERMSNVRVGPTFDNAVFVSTAQGKKLNNDALRYQYIYASSNSAKQTNAVAKNIEASIKVNHGGEADFSVLTRNDAVAVSNQETRLVSTVAIIIMSMSLLVAGVGIMNIMLMLVTERTREIGIRKAVGATNRQIGYQFFAEALVLSCLGGLVGILLSAAVVAGVDAYTDVRMSISWQMAALGLGIPIVIGSIFGLLPALKAARKNPIEALRGE